MKLFRLQLPLLASAEVVVLVLCSCLLAGAQLTRGPVHSRIASASEPSVFQHRRESAQSAFTFGAIDYPNAPQTIATGINRKGEIVGAWGPGLDNYTRGLPVSGFSLKGGTFKKIVYPNAFFTVPFGVSASGEVVGYYSTDSQDLGGQGFTLVGKTFSSVSYPNAQYTALIAINKGGGILVQACFNGEFFCRYYTLQNGSFSSQILYPGSQGIEAAGLNDAGEIVGCYSNDEVTEHGFTDVNGTFATEDYPGAANTCLYGINNSGQIVGVWDDGSVDQFGQPLTHGFLLDNGTFTSFDSPYAGVSSTWPFGINDKSVIVGQTIDANDFFLGFEAQPAK